MAYAHSFGDCIRSFDARVKLKIAALTFDRLSGLLKGIRANETSAGVAHEYTIVAPLPDDRSICSVNIATPYLLNELYSALRATQALERARLYDLFVQSSMAKASAGYMLEHFAQGYLSKGGHWEVFEMTKNRLKNQANDIWSSPGPTTTPATTTKNYLSLGLGAKSPFAFLKCDSPPKTRVEPILHLPFKPGTIAPFSQSGFYQPSHGSQAMFDAFIYDAPAKTALALQITVANKHSAASKGFQWLRDCGVETIHYAIVTPPGPITVPIPKSVDGLVQDKYQLVIESLEEREVEG